MAHLNSWRTRGRGGFAYAADRRKHLRSVNLFATTRGEGVDGCRGESAVRASLNEPIEVLEHRCPEQSICDVRRLDHDWSCSTPSPTLLGSPFEAEGLAWRSIESAAVVSARPAAIPGSAGTLPAGG